MGIDKASIEIDGTTLGERTATELLREVEMVTVLGRSPIEGHSFQSDREPGAGPAVALASFRPSHPLVFVASCDLPRFRSEIVAALKAEIGDQDAAMPVVNGVPQYLCSLYRSSAFEKWNVLVNEAGVRSMRRLVEGVSIAKLGEKDLERHFIKLEWLRGANTPADL